MVRSIIDSISWSLEKKDLDICSSNFMTQMKLWHTESSGLLILTQSLVIVQLTPGSKFQSSLRKILFAISQRKVEQLLYCVRHHSSYGDEVAMTRRQSVETLDRSLQDITGSFEPFGGKVMVFGGNFTQVYRLFLGVLEHRSWMPHCYGRTYGTI